MSSQIEKYHWRVKLVRARVLQKLQLINKAELFPADIEDILSQAMDDVISDAKVEKIITITMKSNVAKYGFNEKGIMEFGTVKTSWDGDFKIVRHSSEEAGFTYTGSLPVVGYIFAGNLIVKPTPTSNCGTIEFYAFLDSMQQEFDPETEPELPSAFDKAWILRACGLIVPELLNDYADELNKQTNKYHKKQLKEIRIESNW